MFFISKVPGTILLVALAIGAFIIGGFECQINTRL